MIESQRICLIADYHSAGPSHFHRLSQAVRMERRGMTGVIAYLDDFLLTASSKVECNEMLLSLIRLLRQLGFLTLVGRKWWGPHNESDFWGWTVTREPALCP